MRDAANDSVVQAAQHRYRDDIELNTKPVIKARTIPAVPWSDLANLVEHVRKSLHLVAQTIAKGTPLGGPESSTNMIVLDEVSPRYARAAATVQACDYQIALRSLLEAGDGGRLTDRPVPSVVGA